ncbi:MAG: winged helix-turn-helix transcriptional regulator [Rubellimicrobium sp.]|nr:winged helix-turn-helix transcriptional regulator [Rubellimicrobium sp.]
MDDAGPAHSGRFTPLAAPGGGGDAPDLDILGDTIGFYIRVLDLAVSRDLDRRLDGLEVARGKGKITSLLLIDRHPGIRPSELADRTLKDRAQIARIIEGFIAHGLVERRTADDDSRAADLRVTAKGAALATRVRQTITAQDRAFFAPLIAGEDRQRLIALLRRAYLGLLAREGGIGA